MTRTHASLELDQRGYCVLRGILPTPRVDECREAFRPILRGYLGSGPEPNRGPARHFLPMPFEPPCFCPEFFFHPDVLRLVRDAMDDRVVADQWGCDVPLPGSQHQGFHVDFARPLFPESPNLRLPPYMLAVSFGLVRITPANGPIEIAPGTHRMPKEEALAAVESGTNEIDPVPLEIGDVLVRHPWALHRGTPNATDEPRPLVTIRYVRRWYADGSREVNVIPSSVWRTLTEDQQRVMRFPVTAAGSRRPDPQ